MPAKRGDRAAPPHRPGGYAVRFATTAAAKGWEELCRTAEANTWNAWVILTERPTTDTQDSTSRQHRLKGDLARLTVDGFVFDRWQYEFTSGGRIWYFINEERKTVWTTWAGTGHPKLTD